MICKDFQGMKLSNLGLGCMRLPVVDGNDAVVDQAAVEKMVALAMERGVNYYDTAWAYPGHRQGSGRLSPGQVLSGQQIPRL